MNEMNQTYWLSPELDEREVSQSERRTGRLTPDPDRLRRIALDLRQRKEALAALPVQRIVNALDKASNAWLQKSKRLSNLVQAIAANTGTSPEMVGLSIQLEMESSRAPDIIAALENEFGIPEVLDDFVPNPHLRGRTHAQGPELISGIVSSNIPALPHLTVMRSLLVKSPCLVKSSAGEPLFLPAYLKTLHEIDPMVASAVAVVSFDRSQTELFNVLLSEGEALIAYGGQEAMSEIRRHFPPEKPALYHGHRLGFAILDGTALTGDHLTRTATQLAWDVVLFDQEACLAPHLTYVLGSKEQASELARAVADRMKGFARTLPGPERSLGSRLALRNALDSLYMSPDSEVFLCGDGTDGVVTVQTSDEFMPSPLGRFLRILPMRRWEDIVGQLRELRGLMQNAAINTNSVQTRRKWMLALASLGVSRICSPGNMGTPTMMWHHDGHACLTALVQWCDYEPVPPHSIDLDELSRS